jgi:hypothetical protein
MHERPEAGFCRAGSNEGTRATRGQRRRAACSTAADAVDLLDRGATGQWQSNSILTLAALTGSWTVFRTGAAFGRLSSKSSVVIVTQYRTAMHIYIVPSGTRPCVLPVPVPSSRMPPHRVRSPVPPPTISHYVLSTDNCPTGLAGFPREAPHDP